MNTIISRCKYTVHLVAADEHRKSFNLVHIRCITGKERGGHTKRGVELHLPGIHCDVGGSYVAGRKEVNEFVSPLHLMLEFAKRKSILFLDDLLLSKYKFTPYSGRVKGKELSQHPNNIAFLTRIKTLLWNYAFGDRSRMAIAEGTYTEPNYFTSPENAAQARKEYKARQQQGQAALDAALLEKNKDLRMLRNMYLHFNASYYDKVIGVYNPRMEGNTEGAK